jgi:hypothetical protein
MKKQESNMQDNNEAIDKFRELADSMHNFEAEPPAGMWNRIEGGLVKRRRRIMIFRYSSIAASLILLLGLGVTYFTTDIFRSSGNKMISDSELQTNAKSGTDSSKGKINYPPENAKTATDDNRNVPSIKVGDPSNQKETLKQEEALDKGAILKDPNPLKKLINSDPLLAENSLKTGKRIAENSLKTGNRVRLFPEEPVLEGIDLAVIAHLNPYPAYTEPEEVDDLHPGEYANDWSLAMGYGITSGADFTNNDEVMNSGADRFSHDDFSADLANETSYFEEIDNTVHDAPLSLGIIVDKRLSRRLSFETGITYTLLSFRVKTDELSPYYKKYRNELNYLGLPAGIRYRFLDRNKFNLYTLQWVVLEKGIGGRWYVDTYTNDVITESESKQQNIRGFQLSSVTGLGAEVKLGGKFYLFAQGGVQVFFMNKTQPYNIRSTQIAWPSVQTGLRINLD